MAQIWYFRGKWQTGDISWPASETHPTVTAEENVTPQVGDVVVPSLCAKNVTIHDLEEIVAVLGYRYNFETRTILAR